MTHPASITEGVEYTLCYDAKAAAVRTIGVGIDADADGVPSMADSAYSNHTTMPEDLINLTTEYVTYDVTFVGTVTDPSSRVVFSLGIDDADVSLDNIGLFEGNTCGTLNDGLPGPGSSSSGVPSSGPITARQAAGDMGMGINIGNTFDAHTGDLNVNVTETFWRSNPLRFDDIEAFVAEGYGHVRIPATWYNHTQTSPPYAIDATRLNSYERVVDWALGQGLYVIINTHHEEWLKGNFSNGNRARFRAIWAQLIDRFADKSPKLIFEILNEPGFYDAAIDRTVELSSAQTDTINREILEQIREREPTRLVIYAGTGFSGIGKLEAATIPDASDQYLFANFHSYDPFEFGIKCAESWLVERDRNALAQVYRRAAAYSANNNNVPLMVNEFGAPFRDFTDIEKVCDTQQRLDYLQAHAELQKQYNVVPTVWSDGGSFGVYSRPDNRWDASSGVMLDAYGRKER